MHTHTTHARFGYNKEGRDRAGFDHEGKDKKGQLRFAIYTAVSADPKDPKQTSSKCGTSNTSTGEVSSSGA